VKHDGTTNFETKFKISGYYLPFKDEAQIALFKGPVRTAL